MGDNFGQDDAQSNPIRVQGWGGQGSLNAELFPMKVVIFGSFFLSVSRADRRGDEHGSEFPISRE